MNLIKDLQEDLLESKNDLPTILRKAKLLASNLRNEEMKIWVDHELNGYSNESQVPDYRRVHVENRGLFQNQYKILEDIPIPILEIKKYFEDIDEEFIITQGVSSLESLLKSGDTKFKNFWPPDLINILANEIYKDYTCMDAWKSFDIAQVEQVLDSVRNRLLNFVIELQEMYPEISKSEDALLTIPEGATVSIFKTNIFKNNTIMVSGSDINQEGQVNVINQNVGKTSSNIFAPTIKNVSHEKTGDIHYGNKISNQIITDNLTYDIDKVDIAFHEKASILIINKFGEKNPKIVGIISIIAGLVTIFGYIFDAFSENIEYFSWINSMIPSIPAKYGTLIIIIGVLLTSIGTFLLTLVQYKYESRCPDCKRFYAKIEVGEPTEREVKVKGGVRRTTFRTYECKYDDCDYSENKKTNTFIRDSELLND